MSSLAAFVHHLAAFTLVAALAIEFVLIRDELTARSARRIRIADAVFGAASGVLVVERRLRRVIHAELAVVVLIVLCAALMARGVGQF